MTCTESRWGRKSQIIAGMSAQVVNGHNERRAGRLTVGKVREVSEQRKYHDAITAMHETSGNLPALHGWTMKATESLGKKTPGLGKQ